MSNNYLFGVDVSKHNGAIDFAKLSKKVDFVILRCAYRGYSSKGTIAVDSRFKEYAGKAKQYGIPTGIYFFSQAKNDAEAKSEAKTAVELYQMTNKQLPIFIDTENSTNYPNGRADRLDKATRTNVVLAFCQKVKELGYQPGIYASTSWFYDKLSFNRVKNYPLWVADYRGTCGLAIRSIWQYSSKGKVDGIRGNVDVNRLYATSLVRGYKAPTGGNPYKEPTTVINRHNSEYGKIKTPSDGVRWVQWWIQRLGLYADKIDGFFGPKTETAVKKFQQSKGLDVDGSVGPITRNALKGACK